ncbi:CDP-glycerol glycerophosphotransferase family protein [Pseudomonadales bacterium]|nr:CDP-glycerol glycerophosphotransferase family protein [Pseudomonadales bacterium]
MGVNVLIFANQIRPKDNWLGLLRISIAAEIVDKVTLVGATDGEFLEQEKVIYKKAVDIREIMNHRLVFGLPSKYTHLKLINLFSGKAIFLGVVPGKVTKALGSFQGATNRFAKKTLIFAKSLLPYNYTLAQDFEDAMYLSAAFGQDIGSYLPIGLPKNVYIASEFLKDSGVRDIGILFVPTHRWDGNVSIVAEWLGDKDFVTAMKKFNVYYNNHPNEEERAVIHESVIDTKTLSGSLWGNIDILVTDYSSIAHDYLAAGGKNVIHIIPDLKDFEEHEGKSPLTYESQFPGVEIHTKIEFLEFLENITDFKRDTINVTEYSNVWIGKILSHK